MSSFTDSLFQGLGTENLTAPQGNSGGAKGGYYSPNGQFIPNAKPIVDSAVTLPTEVTPQTSVDNANVLPELSPTTESNNIPDVNIPDINIPDVSIKGTSFTDSLFSTEPSIPHAESNAESISSFSSGLGDMLGGAYDSIKGIFGRSVLNEDKEKGINNLSEYTKSMDEYDKLGEAGDKQGQIIAYKKMIDNNIIDEDKYNKYKKESLKNIDSNIVDYKKNTSDEFIASVKGELAITQDKYTQDLIYKGSTELADQLDGINNIIDSSFEGGNFSKSYWLGKLDGIKDKNKEFFQEFAKQLLKNPDDGEAYDAVIAQDKYRKIAEDTSNFYLDARNASVYSASTHYANQFGVDQNVIQNMGSFYMTMTNLVSSVVNRVGSGLEIVKRDALGMYDVTEDLAHLNVYKDSSSWFSNGGKFVGNIYSELLDGAPQVVPELLSMYVGGKGLSKIGKVLKLSKVINKINNPLLTKFANKLDVPLLRKTSVGIKELTKDMLVFDVIGGGFLDRGRTKEDVMGDLLISGPINAIIGSLSRVQKASNELFSGTKLRFTNGESYIDDNILDLYKDGKIDEANMLSIKGLEEGKITNVGRYNNTYTLEFKNQLNDLSSRINKGEASSSDLMTVKTAGDSSRRGYNDNISADILSQNKDTANTIINQSIKGDTSILAKQVITFIKNGKDVNPNFNLLNFYKKINNLDLTTLGKFDTEEKNYIRDSVSNIFGVYKDLSKYDSIIASKSEGSLSNIKEAVIKIIINIGNKTSVNEGLIPVGSIFGKYVMTKTGLKNIISNKNIINKNVIKGLSDEGNFINDTYESLMIVNKGMKQKDVVDITNFIGLGDIINGGDVQISQVFNSALSGILKNLGLKLEGGIVYSNKNELEKVISHIGSFKLKKGADLTEGEMGILKLMNFKSEYLKFEKNNIYDGQTNVTLKLFNETSMFRLWTKDDNGNYNLNIKNGNKDKIKKYVSNIIRSDSSSTSKSDNLNNLKNHDDIISDRKKGKSDKTIIKEAVDNSKILGNKSNSALHNKFVGAMTGIVNNISSGGKGLDPFVLALIKDGLLLTPAVVYEIVNYDKESQGGLINDILYTLVMGSRTGRLLLKKKVILKYPNIVKDIETIQKGILNTFKNTSKIKKGRYSQTIPITNNKDLNSYSSDIKKSVIVSPTINETKKDYLYYIKDTNIDEDKLITPIYPKKHKIKNPNADANGFTLVKDFNILDGNINKTFEGFFTNIKKSDITWTIINETKKEDVEIIRGIKYDSYKGGFNLGGFNKKGFNKRGFNLEGYNKDGFDSSGFDIKGYNKKGLDYTGRTMTQADQFLKDISLENSLSDNVVKNNKVKVKIVSTNINEIGFIKKTFFPNTVFESVTIKTKKESNELLRGLINDMKQEMSKFNDYEYIEERLKIFIPISKIFNDRLLNLINSGNKDFLKNKSLVVGKLKLAIDDMSSSITLSDISNRVKGGNIDKVYEDYYTKVLRDIIGGDDLDLKYLEYKVISNNYDSIFKSQNSPYIKEESNDYTYIFNENKGIEYIDSNSSVLSDRVVEVISDVNVKKYYVYNDIYNNSQSKYTGEFNIGSMGGNIELIPMSSILTGKISIKSDDNILIGKATFNTFFKTDFGKTFLLDKTLRKRKNIYGNIDLDNINNFLSSDIRGLDLNLTKVNGDDSVRFNQSGMGALSREFHDLGIMNTGYIRYTNDYSNDQFAFLSKDSSIDMFRSQKYIMNDFVEHFGDATIDLIKADPDSKNILKLVNNSNIDNTTLVKTKDVLDSLTNLGYLSGRLTAILRSALGEEKYLKILDSDIKLNNVILNNSIFRKSMTDARYNITSNIKNQDKIRKFKEDNKRLFEDMRDTEGYIYMLASELGKTGSYKMLKLLVEDMAVTLDINPYKLISELPYYVSSRIYTPIDLLMSNSVIAGILKSTGEDSIGLIKKYNNKLDEVKDKIIFEHYLGDNQEKLISSNIKKKLQSKYNKKDNLGNGGNKNNKLLSSLTSEISELKEYIGYVNNGGLNKTVIYNILTELYSKGLIAKDINLFKAVETIDPKLRKQILNNIKLLSGDNLIDIDLINKSLRDKLVEMISNIDVSSKSLKTFGEEQVNHLESNVASLGGSEGDLLEGIIDGILSNITDNIKGIGKSLGTHMNISPKYNIPFDNVSGLESFALNPYNYKLITKNALDKGIDEKVLFDGISPFLKTNVTNYIKMINDKGDFKTISNAIKFFNTLNITPKSFNKFFRGLGKIENVISDTKYNMSHLINDKGEPTYKFYNILSLIFKKQIDVEAFRKIKGQKKGEYSVLKTYDSKGNLIKDYNNINITVHPVMAMVRNAYGSRINADMLELGTDIYNNTAKEIVLGGNITRKILNKELLNKSYIEKEKILNENSSKKLLNKQILNKKYIENEKVLHEKLLKKLKIDKEKILNNSSIKKIDKDIINKSYIEKEKILNKKMFKKIFDIKILNKSDIENEKILNKKILKELLDKNILNRTKLEKENLKNKSLVNEVDINKIEPTTKKTLNKIDVSKNNLRTIIYKYIKTYQISGGIKGFDKFNNMSFKKSVINDVEESLIDIKAYKIEAYKYIKNKKDFDPKLKPTKKDFDNLTLNDIKEIKAKLFDSTYVKVGDKRITKARLIKAISFGLRDITHYKKVIEKFTELPENNLNTEGEIESFIIKNNIEISVNEEWSDSFQGSSDFFSSNGGDYNAVTNEITIGNGLDSMIPGMGFIVPTKFDGNFRIDMDKDSNVVITKVESVFKIPKISKIDSDFSNKVDTIRKEHCTFNDFT